MGHQQLSQSSPGGQLLDLWEKPQVEVFFQSYRVFFKKVLHKREGKMQERLMMN